jgi:hypothetical protein
MFAFSQIIAQGGNPMEIALSIEKDEANAPKKNNGFDEDQAMAAFAQHLNDEDSIDPE